MVAVVRWSQGKPPTPEQIKRGGGGRGNSRPSTPAPMTREQYNQVFEDYRAGRISQAQAIGSLRGSEAQTYFEQKSRELAQTQQNEKNQAKAEQQRQIELKRQQDIRIALERERLNKERLEQNTLSVSGNQVRYGNKVYIGSSYIPEVGMTASEYAREIRERAVESGEIKKEEASRTDFRNIKTGTETTESGEKILYDNFGNVVGVEADLGGGYKSLSKDEYISEVERLNKVLPQTAVLDTNTGLLSSGDIPNVKIGDVSIQPSNLVKIYTDPKTGKPIEGIKDYLKENNILYKSNINNKNIFKKDTPVYDVSSLREKSYSGGFGNQGIKINNEWIPPSSAYGTVTPITPTDLTVATGAVLGAPLVAPYVVSKAGAIIAGGITIDKAIDVADVVGYSTGANVKVRSFLKGGAEKLYAYSAEQDNKILSKLSFTGGVVADIAGELPAQSKTELAVDLAVVQGFSSSYKAIKYPTRIGIGGYSGYKLVTGETVAEKGLGALGVLAVTPDIVKTSKVLGYKFSPSYSPTKTDITGIKYTNLDFSEIDSSFVEPVRLEFIPAQNKDFSADIIPIKTMGADIPFKEIPSFPKVSSEQRAILDVVRKEGDVVSGSFAQQTLVKDSRQFKDLDILSRNPEKLANKISEEYPDLFRVEKKTITDSPLGNFDIYKVYSKKTGEQLADLDPIKFSEEGLARFGEPIEVGKTISQDGFKLESYNDKSINAPFKDTLFSLKENIVEVSGLKLLPPEIRLTSKVLQSARPLKGYKKLKVITDIAQLTGNKELTTSPSLLRGYGLSKAEQKLAFLGGDFFSTHGGINVLPRFKKKFVIGGEKVGSPDLFFGTPSKADSSLLFGRESRGGLGGKDNQATIRDLFKGAKINWFGSGRKNFVIERGKLGEDFIQPNLGTSEIEVARVLPKEGTEVKTLKTFRTVVDGEPVKIAYVEKSIIDINSDLNTPIIEQPNIKSITSSTSRNEYKDFDLTPRTRNEFVDKDKLDIFDDTKVERVDVKRVDSLTKAFQSQTIVRTTQRSSGRNAKTNIPFRTDTVRVNEPVRTITPRIDSPRTSIRTPRLDVPLRTTPRTPRLDVPLRTKKPESPLKIKFDFPSSTTRQPKGLYSVEVRRGGKFFNVGTTRSLNKAIGLGTSKVSRTLGATYRIKGLKGPTKLSTPKGFYSKTDKKEGLVFIEKRKFRLSTGSETGEIQGYKSIKKRKKSSQNGSYKASPRRKKKKKGLFDDLGF